MTGSCSNKEVRREVVNHMHNQISLDSRTDLQLIFSEQHHDPPKISSTADRKDIDPLELVVDADRGNRNIPGMDGSSPAYFGEGVKPHS